MFGSLVQYNLDVLAWVLSFLKDLFCWAGLNRGNCLSNYCTHLWRVARVPKRLFEPRAYFTGWAWPYCQRPACHKRKQRPAGLRNCVILRKEIAARENIKEHNANVFKGHKLHPHCILNYHHVMPKLSLKLHSLNHCYRFIISVIALFQYLWYHSLFQITSMVPCNDFNYIPLSYFLVYISFPSP